MVPLQNEPPAKIFIDTPLPPALSLGAAVVPYRTENLRVAPVFGAAALSISPRVGHVHVSVDGRRWVWAHASREPVTVFGLAPGPHEIRIKLMTANHQQLDEGAVKFIVPETGTTLSSAPNNVRHLHAPALDHSSIPLRAKIIIDSPLPEPLARGVVFIRYRTENLELVPIFGDAALSVSPRIGHIHVTVDDAPWHWVEASGNPVIVQGLSPGRHRILLELANANHKVLDQGMVELTIPGATGNPRAR